MIVILDDKDADRAVNVLIEREFRVTRVASTGGFMRRGNTTLLIGLRKERVEEAIESIREIRSVSQDAGRRRAMVFVLDTQHFEQI
jgi:uncharacterized protein YaaQ